MLGKVIIENGQKKIQALTADTGVGAPVGSIIVVCSNILPSGYLGLGVQYDITNYPALYQVLGTDTTPTASALGLPTLSSGQYAIKATSGLTENQQENVLNTINENNSYSTEEHPTGAKWIDGKPIYRRVYTGTVGNNSQIPLNISNLERVTKLDGVLWYISNNLQYILQLNNPNDSGYFSRCNIEAGERLNFIMGGWTVINAQVIVEYTKTTD